MTSKDTPPHTGPVQDYIVDNPGGLDVAFTGEKLIAVNYHDIGAVQLYRTEGGRILMRQRRSSRPGFIDINRLEIGTDLETVLTKLVNGAGATAIRRELGVESHIRLD